MKNHNYLTQNTEVSLLVNTKDIYLKGKILTGKISIGEHFFNIKYIC